MSTSINTWLVRKKAGEQGTLKRSIGLVAGGRLELPT